jgi:hypothetical protein
VIAMLLGTALALAALAYVLYPLLHGSVHAGALAPPARSTVEPDRFTAIDALREVEFDYATGKLSDADYRALKDSYTGKAVAELRARGSVATAACPSCGVRPEQDALFCSNCGRMLAG